jgi:hypothetical protein
MLFRPDLAQLILEGRKTQTRRIVKHGDWPYTLLRVVKAINRHGRLIWKVNDGTVDWLSEAGAGGFNDGSRGDGCGSYRQPTYAVQPGRGKLAIGRIRFTAIRSENLWDISIGDVEREGLRPADRTIDFLDDFRDTWDLLNPDKPYRWQDNPAVWVLTFARV